MFTHNKKKEIIGEFCYHRLWNSHLQFSWAQYIFIFLWNIKDLENDIDSFNINTHNMIENKSKTNNSYLICK